MKLLSLLWPFRGGDVATAVTDDDFVSVPRSLLTEAKRLFALVTPIPLAERRPGPDDLGGFDNNCCWWGHWQYDHWSWTWDYEPVRDETHWLPASVEVLPVRCYPPEAKP